jgi:hypothetical protein
VEPVTVIVQTPAIVNWAVGIMAVLLSGLVVRIENIASRVKEVEADVAPIGAMASDVHQIKAAVYHVKAMHEHPDDYNFGNKETNAMVQRLMKCCSANCQESERVWRSIDKLSHTLAYDIEQRTGKKPPPPPLEVKHE